MHELHVVSNISSKISKTSEEKQVNFISMITEVISHSNSKIERRQSIKCQQVQ